MVLPVRECELSGWGRHPVQRCGVLRPDRYGDLSRIEADTLPRGLGRSYGDSSLNQGGRVVEMTRLNRILEFDETLGILVAEAGLSLAEVAEIFLPRGWFLPVTPGTKFVTLGGAIASDVHGKNHHGEGCFSAHVAWIELFTPALGRLTCSPEEHPEIFWATVGGQGLTGIIGAMALQLKPVSSLWMEVTHHPARELESAFNLLSDPEADAPYTVAWIDCLAKGRELGRSIFMAGHHRTEKNLPPAKAPRSKPLIQAPFNFPSGCLNSLTVRAFNGVYYRRNGRKRFPFLSAMDPFFYPLDMVGHWNRIYGRRGFVQYQSVLPPGTAFEGVKAQLEEISAAEAASFLAVLKRLGAAGPGHLSFPTEGYTLALDLPYRGPETEALLKRLDAIVLKGGGRVNLCKDAHLSPESFRAMYPRFEEWLGVKAQVDPEWMLQSSLSRRLRMKEGA
ncbi:FAD-binding protein [Holophaga foetida]|uniref:FAD-binding protein n=1 Tax=Holophaga foetida TaxID=35839 RepID=UPI000247425F|nr:FAD-binding oxidoreductase [Holophaga foetida]